MSTVVVGGGLAGLATAIKLRYFLPYEEVVLVEKSRPESNSQIAGQRYREGVAGRRTNPVEEMIELFASRNKGEVTPGMVTFANTSIEEQLFWRSLMGEEMYGDNPLWFGQQWGKPNPAGKGRGKSVLDWFWKTAEKYNVTVLTGEAHELDMNVAEGKVNGIFVMKQNGRNNEGYVHLQADRYVLAGGNIGGRLYESTNKPIFYTPQELCFSLGLTDSTEVMVHPLGGCGDGGKAKVGCEETDTLEGAQIYSGKNQDQRDLLVERWLREHQAHYKFPEIVKRFMEGGGVVRIVKDGHEKLARVSHHYSHIGVWTEDDGVTIRGMSNLYGAGDAVGPGPFIAHKERYPGVALGNNLVTAALIANHLRDSSGDPMVRMTQVETDFKPKIKSGREYDEDESKVRSINTARLALITNTEPDETKVKSAVEWVQELQAVSVGEGGKILRDISLATAYAYHEMWRGESEEPFVISQETANRVLKEGCVVRESIPLLRRLETSRTPVMVERSYGGRKEAF